MPRGARRPAGCLWRPLARRALLTLGAGLLALPVAAACLVPPGDASGFSRESLATLPCVREGSADRCKGTGIVAAWYDLPTERYQHGVLGDAIEGGRLGVLARSAEGRCTVKSVTLEDSHVF